jgi:RNA polymerase sigma-70 factor (ECF subfamily)
MRAKNVTRAGRAPPELDDATLVRCRAQDPTAFQAFVTRYERVVFAVLSQMLGHGPHVEDLAQDTFLRAYIAFPRYDLERAKPSRWILTIATRLALNHRKRGNLSALTTSSPVCDDSPESESIRHELGRAIERAIAALSDEQRAVFVLAELHDLTLVEIADALGVPENTVKTRLLRAREQLRGRLRRRRNGPHGPR